MKIRNAEIKFGTSFSLGQIEYNFSEAMPPSVSSPTFPSNPQSVNV